MIGGVLLCFVCKSSFVVFGLCVGRYLLYVC